MKQIIFATILALAFSFSAFAQTQNSLCATIKVTGGGVVRAGDPMSFSAEVAGITKNSTVEYEWKVSSGTISSGQGTPSITVDTTGLANGTNITAEIKIKGLYVNCANTASETGGIAPEIPLEILDEYGNISDNDVKARMEALFIRLNENPTAQGYIINYGTNREITIREKQIRRAIAFRKYDSNRVTMVRGGANPNRGVWTKVWDIYPGGKIPLP